MTLASDTYDTDAIYSGFVDFQGGIDVLPTGWTITRPIVGRYVISPNFVQTINKDLRVIVSVVNKIPSSIGLVYMSGDNATSFTIHTEKNNKGFKVDQAFFFVAIRV